jgi:hypothetical protein
MAPSQAAPTNPKAFGEELRTLREEAGLTLDDIIAETKISRRILDALECGKYQYLPERVFCKNFVRQYARVMRADEDRLVGAFEAAWERFLLTSGSHPPVIVPAPEPRPLLRWRFWLPIGLGAIVLLAVAAVMVRGLVSPNGLSQDPRRFSSAMPTPTPGPLPPTPVVGDRWRAAERSGDSVHEDEVVKIRAKVRDGTECWLHYRDREGNTDQRLLLGGEELALSLAGPVSLTVGNAGGVSLMVGEKEYGQLGLPGQVVHAEVSPAGLVKLGAGAAYEQ